MATKVVRKDRVMTWAESIIDLGISSLDMIDPRMRYESMTEYKYTWIVDSSDRRALLESVWLSILHEQVIFYQGTIDINALFQTVIPVDNLVIPVTDATIKDTVSRALEQDLYGKSLESIRVVKTRVLEKCLMQTLFELISSWQWIDVWSFMFVSSIDIDTRLCECWHNVVWCIVDRSNGLDHCILDRCGLRTKELCIDLTLNSSARVGLSRCNT